LFRDSDLEDRIYNPTSCESVCIEINTMASYVPPGQHRSLRACMVCSIVQPSSRFMNQGCPNCEDFLELAGHSDSIQDCTSQVFEGLITLADPSQSWVAKWQRLKGYVPGVYAVKVQGMVGVVVFSYIEIMR